MVNNIYDKRLNSRQSNMELLRIISMMMIIGIHYFNGSMGGALSNIDTNNRNYYLVYGCMSLFIIGVNSFVLITGYYQINTDKLKVKKIIKLLISMLFYINIFYFISILLKQDTFNIKEFVKLQLPFIFDRYWFIKIYIILYSISPYLNIVLKNINKKQYQILLTITGICFSVWPSFLSGAPNNDGGYGIITFIFLYSIGAYLKLFPSNKIRNRYLFLLLYLISSMITYMLSINGLYSWGYNFVFNVLGSICLFEFFIKLDIKSKIINLLASTTLSVYFIHVDYSIRIIIYNKILRCQNYYESNIFIIHMILSVFIIFIIAAFISILFKMIFKHIYIGKKYVVSLWNKIIDILIILSNNTLYIVDYIRKKIKKAPQVMSIDETIDYIIRNKCSVSRYGDGELKLMNSKSIFFQEYSKILSDRLKIIANSELDNHIVCIPDIFDNLSIYDNEPYKYWKLHIAKTRTLWYSILNKEKQYYNSFISRCYYMYKDKSKSREWFNKIKLIWSDRDIVIIEGEKSRLGIGNDLFNNCKSIERILCPAKDSFNKYEEILEEARKIDKNKLVLLALGPTATVLAYDLCKLGYQAIDIGHLDIEYEWFLMGATKKEKINNKFIGEAKGGDEVGEFKDSLYLNQVISAIE